jgi:ribonuclease P protein component
MAEELPKPLRFSRAMRIKQGRDFTRLKQQGLRIVNGCLIANLLKLSPGSPLRLGVVTSKRIGNAVVRNRARRLMREVFRVHQHELAAPIDLVLVARPSIAGKSLESVERDFLTTLRKAGLLKQSIGAN